MYKLYLALILAFSFNQLQAQRTEVLSLYNVVDIARSSSPDARLAQVRLKNNFWKYKAFESKYKPQMRLATNSFNFNRSLQSLTLDDGSLSFIETSTMTTGLSLLLEQDIAYTGGSVAVGMSLNRNDNFITSPKTSYLSTPISIRISQPLFSFNPMKWERKIEPLKYKESKKRSAEQIENSANKAVRFFFDVYIAQIQLDAALQDKINADTLYLLSKNRFKVGKIAENDLLQIELGVMDADNNVAKAKLKLQTTSEKLRSMLSIDEIVVFDLHIPEDIPQFEIDTAEALATAKENRSTFLNYQLRLLNRERAVAVAIDDAGVQASLNLNFGLSQSAETLSNAYSRLQDQERIGLTLSVPIADWGKNKSKKEIAQSNFELEQLNINLERVSFEREIIISIQQLSLKRKQVTLADKSYVIAQKSYEIAEARYKIGKIGITDLNSILAKRNMVRQQYFNAIKAYWLNYYNIRKLTLYDFHFKQSLAY